METQGSSASADGALSSSSLKRPTNLCVGRPCSWMALVGYMALLLSLCVGYARASPRNTSITLVIGCPPSTIWLSGGNFLLVDFSINLSKSEVLTPFGAKRESYNWISSLVNSFLAGVIQIRGHMPAKQPREIPISFEKVVVNLAIGSFSWAGFKLPLVKPILTADCSIASPRPKPTASLTQLPRPAAARVLRPRTVPNVASMKSPHTSMMQLSAKPKPKKGTATKIASDLSCLPVGGVTSRAGAFLLAGLSLVMSATALSLSKVPIRST
mmetsp:Transcript_6468/g.14142  ORF Transcript_6468/g.14142 Transcript_6468/m.14142 type:complete len:270 (-) Transcript_6468:830-1639(-)